MKMPWKGCIYYVLYIVMTLDIASSLIPVISSDLFRKIFASTKFPQSRHILPLDCSLRDPLDFRNINLKKNIPSLNTTDILLSRRRNSWWPFKGSLTAEIPEYLDGKCNILRQLFNDYIVLTHLGTLAGDNGFDPLRLARNKEQLFLFREAEYKHARLAMLAALGWPSSGMI